MIIKSNNKQVDFAIVFDLPSGFFNKRRLERDARLRIAEGLGMNIVSLPSLPKYELKELFDEEIGATWYDEVQLNDGSFMPYPHYAFPRALPTELKGVAV